MGLIMQLIFGDSDVKRLMKGRNAEQKKAILYFEGGNGCLNQAMKDDEYEAMVQAVAGGQDFRKKALSKCGLDEDEVKTLDPVHFEDFVIDERTPYAKLGADRRWRSSRYQISWLFFSEQQVYVWQYTHSFIDDERKEATEEYFYKDVTNFSTSSDTVEKEVLDKVTCTGKRKKFRTNIDSNRFALVVPGDKFYCSMEQNDQTEKAVKGMKALLREKKT